jgi:hypothetical protein
MAAISGTSAPNTPNKEDFAFYNPYNVTTRPAYPSAAMAMRFLKDAGAGTITISGSTQTVVDFKDRAVIWDNAGSYNYTPAFAIATAADLNGNPITITGGNSVPIGPDPVYVTKAPVFQIAVSRKTHGTAGDFDIALNTEPGFESIECRSGGSAGAYTLVFAFDQAVESAQASVVSGAGSIAAGSPAFDPENQTVGVDLTGVTSGQKITVRLSDIGGIAGQTAEISLRLLAGDTNGDRVVNIADTAQTQSRSGQSTGAANFRSDVNGDGKINIADTAFIRSQSGKSVP